MLVPRWTYENSQYLYRWYGHVDYFGQYIMGQWFVLEAATGTELWARRFNRPNSILACEQDVIIASEMRSDGPWTADFGIYGIAAKTGDLLWTSHARGWWGKFLRCCDYIPAFTNDLRDPPRGIVNGRVITGRGRCLDVRTGVDVAENYSVPANNDNATPQRILYDKHVLDFDTDKIFVEGPRDDFKITRYDPNGREIWRLSCKERALYMDGNYFSYRYHEGRIYLILGDAPRTVPIKPSDPFVHKPNLANYQIGVLELTTGECRLAPLDHGQQRLECRIEAIHQNRLLVSCDNTILTEYQIQ